MSASLSPSVQFLSTSSMPSPNALPIMSGGPSASPAQSRLKVNNSPSAQNVLDQIYSSGVVPIKTARSASPTVFTQNGVVESVPIVPSFIATSKVVNQNITMPRSPRSSSPIVLPNLPEYVPIASETVRPRTPPKVSPPSSPTRGNLPRSPPKVASPRNLPMIEEKLQPATQWPSTLKESSFKEGIDSNLIFNNQLLHDASLPVPVSQYAPYIKEEERVSNASKSNRIHDYVETVSETSIESQLTKYKYTIIDRVVLKREDGFQTQYNVEYVKCYDPNGLTVFVMLDVKGSLGVQMPDLTTVHVAKGSSIPLSDKLAANDCAGTGVCGVALECPDELCTILRQNDGSSKEASFVMTEEYSTKTMARDGSSVASVIIRMSEIMQDYKGTLDRTRAASQRIRENAFKASHEGLERTMKKAQTLTEGISKFDSNRKLAYLSLKNGIAQLQLYSDKYYAMYTDNTITSQNNNLYNQTIGNLYARNKVFSDIITTTTAFNDLEKDIEAIASKIIALNNSLCAKHEKVTGQLSIDQIREIIKM